MTFSGASAALPSTVSKPILLRNITEHWWLSSTILHFRELFWIMFAYECVKSIREQWCELEVRRRMRICRRWFCELDSFHKRIGRDSYILILSVAPVWGLTNHMPATSRHLLFKISHPISIVQQSSVAGTCRSDHWFHNRASAKACSCELREQKQLYYNML